MRKNILFFHYGGNYLRGSEISLLKILNGLNTDKYNLYFVCNNVDLAKKAEQYCKYVYRVNIPEIMIEAGYVKFQIIQWFWMLCFLIRIIKNTKTDLIYCNSGLPVQTGYYAAKIMGIPIVSHIRAPYYLRYILLYRLNKINKLIFVSEAIRRQFMKKIGIELNSVVILNGFDIDLFAPVAVKDPYQREKLGINSNRIVIGQIGSLIFRKGIDTLLKAFKIVNDQYENTHLVLAGKGDDEQFFYGLVNDLGLNQYVTFTGEIDKPDFLYKHVFDINVLASQSEALGNTLIEGAACELPNIGANVDGIPEIIVDGSSGFLFEAGNEYDLSQKILKLVSNSSLRKSMGISGRNLVINKFTLQNYIDSIENEIDSFFVAACQ